MLRQRLAESDIEAEILRVIRLRTVTAVRQGGPPGAEASVRKAIADDHGQHIMGLAKDLAGPGGMLDDRGPAGRPVRTWWHYGFLFAPALTVGGGTARCSATSSQSGCSAFPTTSPPTDGRRLTDVGRVTGQMSGSVQSLLMPYRAAAASKPVARSRLLMVDCSDAAVKASKSGSPAARKAPLQPPSA